MVKAINCTHRGRFVAAFAAVLLAGVGNQAQAWAAAPVSGLATQAAFLGSPGPAPGQSVITSRGPAFITGQLGSLETTTLPGSGGQGFLMGNGNGTSTLIVPGGVPQVVATPR